MAPRNPEQDVANPELEYWRFYGMESDPFAPSAIEGLFFPGGGCDEVLQSARHVARFSSQAVVFYGPEGVGKSCLLEALALSLDDEHQILRLQVGFMSTAEQLFTEIAQAVDLTAVNFIPSAFAEQLQRQLSSRDDGKPLLILIDDADQLIDQTLQSVLDLADASVEKLHVLLFAATDGNGFLRAELDRGDVQQLAVQAFDQQAMKSYIEYRLQTAGFDGEFPFTDADLASIFKQSLGIAQRIGRVAEQKLRQKIRISGLLNNPDFEDQSHHVPVMHVVLAICLLAFMALGWLFVDGDDDEKADEVVAGSELKTIDRGQKEESAFKPEEQAAELEKAAQIQKTESEREATLQAARKIAAQRARDAKERIAKRLQQQKANADRELKNEADKALADKKRATQVLAEKRLAQQQAATLALAKKQAQAKKDALAKKEAERASLVLRQEKQRQAAAAKLAAEQRAKAAAERQPAGVKVEERGSYTGLSADERMFMQNPSNNFTLQLVASSSKAGIDGFLQQYKAVDIRVFRRVRAQKTWYVATTGLYPDKRTATNAIKNLPAKLAKQKPWAKSLAQVHDEIRAAQKDLP